MKLQYLGTAAAEGLPALFCDCDICREAARRGGKDLRMRSGALVNDRLLIDLNPDTYAATLRFGLSLSGVRNAIITHAHGDHFQRELMSAFTPVGAHIPKENDHFHLWGSAFTANVWEEYMTTMHMAESVLTKYVEFHVLKPYDTVEIEGIRVTALEARHSCQGSFLYVLEQGASRFFYGNDTGLLGEETWDWIAQQKGRPFSAVSLDSTMGFPPNDYYGHMSLDQNIETKKRMIALQAADEHTRFICHHFSHNGLTLQKETEEKMQPHGFLVAYDGLTLEV